MSNQKLLYFKIIKNKIKSLSAGLITILLLLNVNTKAQSIEYISSKVENSITINKSSDKVWELISNFENLSKLVPEVVKEVKINGEGVYASWIIYLNNNQLVKEEMTYFNSTEKEMSYIMTKTPMPLSDYLAIQKVVAINEKQSKIIFTTYFNTLPKNQEMLMITFNNFQNTFLNNIVKFLP